MLTFFPNSGVYKVRKVSCSLVSKIPTNYKRNAITSELRRAKKIATDFDKELWKIKAKVFHTGYPAKFINDKFSRFKIGKKNC